VSDAVTLSRGLGENLTLTLESSLRHLLSFLGKMVTKGASRVKVRFSPSLFKRDCGSYDYFNNEEASILKATPWR
jgi:hypothetical protein